MIRCPKCDTEKPDSEFRNDASRKSGKCAQCKTCKDAWRRAYVIKNSERISARQKAYLRDPKNREHARKRQAEYTARPENRERARLLRNAAYAADPVRAKSRRQKYFTKNWDRKLLKSAGTASQQRQARGRNCPCTITLEHIRALWDAQGGLCYFTGLPLQREMDRLDTVSIDRLDASRGYEPGNVVLAIKAMNFAKTGHSEEEFFALLEQLRWALPFKLTERRRVSVA